MNLSRKHKKTKRNNRIRGFFGLEASGQRPEEEGWRLEAGGDGGLGLQRPEARKG